MRDFMGTDVFYYHGYAHLRIEGNWVKATPAFNVELCEKMNLQPLEFDGRSDSIYHPFDREGRRHMEYIRDHGIHDAVPVAFLQAHRRFEVGTPAKAVEDAANTRRLGLRRGRVYANRQVHGQ